MTLAFTADPISTAARRSPDINNTTMDVCSTVSADCCQVCSIVAADMLHVGCQAYSIAIVDGITLCSQSLSQACSITTADVLSLAVKHTVLLLLMCCH